MLITQCSYCKKYQNPTTDKWQIEIPEGTIQGLEGNITDSHCPKCHKKIMDKIKKLEETE
jgi:protein-disulfide isomerase